MIYVCYPNDKLQDFRDQHNESCVSPEDFISSIEERLASDELTLEEAQSIIQDYFRRSK